MINTLLIHNNHRIIDKEATMVTCSNTDQKRKNSSKPLCADRFTTLPNQILGIILSFLPTKDVAAAQLSCNKLRHVFSLITTIDLDDSPISTSSPRNCPLLLERFPLFKLFVTKVLLQVEDPLTRFRLRFGGDKTTHYTYTVEGRTCFAKCFPNVEPSRLNVWLSYPLAHSGLRDLELTFCLSNPDDCKFPPQLFDFPSLESFRVDANVKINGADILLICLPKVKLLSIQSIVFTQDDFVTRLVLSCPVLEDLCINHCMWEEIDRMTIASHSVKRMNLTLIKLALSDADRTDLVTIDTPNLQYLTYGDSLPNRYSITQMNVLVKAELRIYDQYWVEDAVTSPLCQLSLLRGLTVVQHLSLDSNFLETTLLVAGLDCHLPVFGRLRTITLGQGRLGEWRWDTILLLILHSSPLLETLIFPKGLFYYGRNDVKEEACLEADGWRTNTLPSCCMAHPKRIEFGFCFGIDRELNMIKFFLGKASVLKELVLCLCKDFDTLRGWALPTPNFEDFVIKLEELPRASNSCSIILHG